MPGGREATAPTMPTMPTAPVLVVLAMLTALAPLSIDIYTPSLPRIQQDLAADTWLAQASVTACLLGIGVGQLVWGPLSDRLGRRPVVFVGVGGWGLASVLSAIATTPQALVGARGAAGLCGAAGIVVARSVVRDLSADPRAMAARIGLLAVVTTVAPVIAPVAGAAVAGVWGWRGDFALLAALGLVIWLAFALVVPETAPLRARAGTAVAGVGASLVRALRQRELLLVALALGAQSFGFYAYISTASFVVERELGYPPYAFALVFGTNAAAMLSATLVFRRLARRRHPAGALGTGLAVSAASGTVLLICALVHAPVGLLWVASTAFAAAAGLVLPGAHSWGQLTPVASGAASALTGSAQFLGGVLGSPVTGAIGPTAAHLGAVIAAGSGAGLLAWGAALRHRGSFRPAGAVRPARTQPRQARAVRREYP